MKCFLVSGLFALKRRTLQVAYDQLLQKTSLSRLDRKRFEKRVRDELSAQDAEH
jgi:hypothetical protein